MRDVFVVEEYWARGDREMGKITKPMPSQLRTLTQWMNDWTTLPPTWISQPYQQYVDSCVARCALTGLCGAERSLFELANEAKIQFPFVIFIIVSYQVHWKNNDWCTKKRSKSFVVKYKPTHLVTNWLTEHGVWGHSALGTARVCRGTMIETHPFITVTNPNRVLLFWKKRSWRQILLSGKL